MPDPARTSSTWRPREPLADAFSSREMALLDRLSLRVAAALRSHRSGSRRSRQRGRSGDLLDYRQYIEGDELRDVDWNAFARHEALFTRIFADEISLPLQIFLDVSPSMIFPETTSKLHAAARLAAAAARIAANSETPAFLHTNRLQGIALGRSNGLQPFLTGMQAAIDEGRVATLESNLRDARRTLRHAMVLVISDGYGGEELLDPLRFLRQSHCEVFFLHLLSSFELAPELPQELTLVDAETGREERVSDDPETLANYQLRLENFLGWWRQKSRGGGIGYACVESEAGLETQVLRGLIECGLAWRR